MDRKAVARETLEIMRQGYYILPGKVSETSPENVDKRIDIQEDMEYSVENSLLINPDEAEQLLKKYENSAKIPCGREELGAYGCGVFRNDPEKVAQWWQELLLEGLGSSFESVFHAVLDRSRNQLCIQAFEKTVHL